ncbi:MAG: 1-acyl-sn-glycerol-3-phosphate acyltransferase [Oligoflexales bacterium]
MIHSTLNAFRFIMLSLVKIMSTYLYSFQQEWISPPPKSWNDVSVILILNHTSLFEFIYSMCLPFNYLWEVSKRLILPVADKTLRHPISGLCFRLLAPKLIALTRKRDQSWKDFLSQIKPYDICIFMPEGRMKRTTGFDQFGNPMTVRKGVFELLERYKGQNMVIVYSKGLHHVFAPGQKYPRFFKKIHAKFELQSVDDFLNQFPTADLVRDELEKRRDTHCSEETYQEQDSSLKKNLQKQPHT